MVQYWRAAGMTYLTYSVKCADLVRQALKEPVRSQVLNRVSYSMIKGNWESGKIVERSTFCSLSSSPLSSPIIQPSGVLVLIF